MKPLPVKSPAKPAVGESPPVGKLWITGLAEPMSEISVPLFDPALSVANPRPSPLKLPRNSEDGAWPTAIRLGRLRLVVEEPAADAGEDLDVIGPAVGHGQVGLRAAQQVAHDHRDRSGVGLDPRPRDHRPARPAALAQQDRDVVGAGVGDQQVGLAVEVGDRDSGRVGADGEARGAVDRRAELAVAQAGVDQHVVAAAVGDDQVGDAVAVQVGQQDGPGASRPVDWLPMTWGWSTFWLVGRRRPDLVERLVGVDEVGDAVAGEVGDGQGDGRLDRLEGLEGAVAVAEQDQHVAVGVADQEVELAVAVRSATVKPVGSAPAS